MAAAAPAGSLTPSQDFSVFFALAKLLPYIPPFIPLQAPSLIPVRSAPAVLESRDKPCQELRFWAPGHGRP